MIKYIKEQISIQLKERLSDNDAVETYINKLYKYFNDIIGDCVEISFIKDETAIDIQIDGTVRNFYSTKKVMDELHVLDSNIKAILIIDADCHFGSYSYMKTEKTTVDDAVYLMAEFIKGIKENIDESTANVNW